MSEKKINTSKSMQGTPELSTEQLKKLYAQSERVFGKQKLVKFAVPKSFSKFIGDTLYIGVNLVGVKIPVDGKSYDIPEVLAAHGEKMLDNLTT